jgi:hypothetical protein
MHKLILCSAIAALLAFPTVASAVPADWIVVTKDKKGNPTGYVTHKMPPVAELTKEYCVDGEQSPLPYPMCFMDVGGPENDDDDR